MRTIYQKGITILILFFALSEISNAQQAQQQIEMTIDNVGNAKIDISMKMNAQQWQSWSTTLGNNPAALKREIERGMPAYFLDDFTLEKDEMNRSFSLSLNAYGVCDIDKRGTWTIDIDQENATLTTLSDHKYMFVSSLEEFGGQLQQNYIINLPENAENIKVDKNAFGRDIFKFKMSSQVSFEAGFTGISRWGGLVIVLIGVLLFIKKIVFDKKGLIVKS